MLNNKTFYLLIVLLNFILLFQLNAQTTGKAWYVDKFATGLNNGTSWANAWTSFASINWASIQPGDTLYISGGNDSTFYYEQLNPGKSGTAGNYIVIRPGLSSGHNGKVIIDGQGIRGYCIYNNSYQYLKVEYLYLRNAITANYRLRASNNIVSNCNFYISSGATDGIDLRATNCIIENNIAVTSSPVGDGQRDFMQCTTGGNHIIRNNTITINNTDPTDHCDGLQFYSPFDAGMTMEIYGNTIWQNNTKTSNAQGIYVSGLAAGAMDNTTWYIYNNLLIAPYGFNMICVRNNNAKYRIYGNTIYQANSTSPGFRVENDFGTTIDDIIVKNNIFYISGSGTRPVGISEAVGLSSQFTNNLIYSPLSTPITYLGSNISIATWNAYSFVGDDLVGDPKFVNISTNNFHLNAGSPAIDAGTALGSPYNVDIEGISRPQGSAWDIGAYEYQSSNIITDNTPPTLISASVINPTTIQLTFSEPLEISSAQTKNNYSINNGIVVNSAVLSSDGKTVTLNTTQNTANQIYTVTVFNVKDLAGNVIAPNTKINYGFQSLPNSTQLPITRVLASSVPELNHTPDKTLDGKGLNDGDADSRWAGRPMPQWIVYDLGGVQTLMTTRLSFYNWDGGRIYNYSIQVSIDSLSWQNVRNNIQSSSFEWSIEDIGSIQARYVKILFLSSNQPDWAGLWEANFWGQISANDDVTPPILVNASVINPTTIQLTFSEALENSSAINKLNYSINNGIIVNSVSLSTDATKVTLNTTQNTANQTYTITVNNVKDLSGNIIQSGSNTAQYSYVGDSTPPSLLSATAKNSTTVELVFSEALNVSSAQTISNYSINNGIIINSVSISSDQKIVTLFTSKHLTNTNYTVVVTNIKDLAGNTIGSVNSTQYTFVDNTIGNLKANVKVYLEGPFSGNSMLTELSGNDFLSSSQPYNSAPWSYNGNEVLGTGASTATDWVLVELHSSQDPKQVVARRACLLRNDGRIMEPNGTLGVTFNNLFYGSYYIVIRHRNHLAVMSSSPVVFSPNNDLYDFTTSVNQAYGQNALVQVSPGVFAMYAGDGNGDGIIDTKDRDVIWNDQNGNMGYLNGDFNLDSGVTVKDINDFWNLNQGQQTQAP